MAAQHLGHDARTATGLHDVDHDVIVLEGSAPVATVADTHAEFVGVDRPGAPQPGQDG